MRAHSIDGRRNTLVASATHDGSRTFAAATLVAAAMTWLLGHPDVVRGGAYPLAMAALCAGWIALGTVMLRTLRGACDTHVARWSCTGALAIVVVGTGASAHLPLGGVLHALHAVIDILAAGDAHAAHLVWNSGHTIVFALLAATLGTLRRRLRLERLTLLTGLVALAAGTEALQRHLPDRTPAVHDLAADLAGIAIGLLCARLGSELRYAGRPAQRRFVLRLDADRRHRVRPESADRRGAAPHRFE